MDSSYVGHWIDRASRDSPQRESGAMSALPKEAPRRQRDLPALRPAVKQRRRRIFLIAGLVLAFALASDWMRPADRQLSVLLYQRVVIRGYRKLLRPIGSHFIRCRYTPTCSAYSEEAMRTHDFPKGLWLTTSRLFRCTPWVKFGTQDPVPAATK